MGVGLKSTDAVDRAIAAGIALLLAVSWELAARSGWISPLVFPPPSRIIADFVPLWREGLGHNLAATGIRFLTGAFAGGIPGIIAGLCIGWSSRLRRIADPFVAAIHPVPKIILFPLFIVIFGVSEVSKIAAIATGVFFPTLISAAAGAREISPLYIEVIRSHGGSTAALFRHVILPGSLPMILSGVRIAANVGLLVTIAIEFTVTADGIGSLIWLAWQTMRTEDLYVAMLTCSLIGIAINASIQWLLHRVAPWQSRD